MTRQDRKPDAGRRRMILDRLKLEGPLDAEALARQLEVSAMAVRQHLYSLAEDGLVAYNEEARPVGRPAKLWYLTPGAQAFFPDGHQELALDLIGALREGFGEAGMDRLLAIRAEEQTAIYRDRIKAGSLKKRLESLAEIRTEEGYMAEVQSEGRGRYLLVENHCPICSAAKTCQGLCAMELQVFRQVLGEGYSVERSDHILAGARRCAYRIEASSGGTGE